MPAGPVLWGTLDTFFEAGPVLGRIVANATFLRALLQAGRFDGYHFFVEDRREVEAVARAIAAELPALWGTGAVVVRDCLALPDALATTPYHCFHLSNCVLFPAHLARARNRWAPDPFPITGVTHTISRAQDAPRFLAQLWAGTTPRDAIVATSRAAERVVHAIFELLRERYRLDAGEFPAPRVHRIPLGIDLDRFAPPSPDRRAAERRRLGAGPDEVLLLVFARLSPHLKMDLLPLFAALARLAPEAARRVRLVAAGALTDDDGTADLLRAVADAEGIPLTLELNPSDAARAALYGAADVFVSPVDNVQESFGLSVLEAGAMGLPAVVSDYDGYRDLVIDGETGFLIPTLGPSCTDDTDALANLWFDSQYHLRLAQQTVVDVPLLADRLTRLVETPALRVAMGQRARERVRAHYAWPIVIDQYLSLWEQLRATPIDAGARRGVPHPLHLAYARVFAGHPSAVVSGDLPLRRSERGEALMRGETVPVVYGTLQAVVRDELVQAVVSRAPATVGELREVLTRDRALSDEHADEVVLWALKHDFVERA